MGPQPQQNILIFDGVCHLCNGAVNFLLKHDHQDRFRFAAFQSEAGKELLKKFEIKADPQDTVILVSEGRAFVFSNAVFETLKILGWPWKIFCVFRIVPRFITDFLYRLVAAQRYRIFGKLNACRLPGPEDREKFL
jgi:predicted DCC family thiol-disulfide oxidoreductase YuxK